MTTTQSKCPRTGRIRYTKKEAKRQAERKKHRFAFFRQPPYEYRCPSCGGWHVGTRTRA